LIEYEPKASSINSSSNTLVCSVFEIKRSQCGKKVDENSVLAISAIALPDFPAENAVPPTKPQENHGFTLKPQENHGFTLKPQENHGFTLKPHNC